MSQYLRMPIAVDAWQWLPGESHEGLVVPYSPQGDDGPCASCGQGMDVHGLLGTDVVCPGDWVIGDRGCYRLCKPEAFADDYKLITNGPFGGAAARTSGKAG
jgi:hypothetical protein